MEVESPRKNSENDDKDFSIIMSLPPELAMMVIDRMTPVARARFAQCSKKSNEAVKSSKNYIVGLSYTDNNETFYPMKPFLRNISPKISITHKPGISNYLFTFRKIGEKKFKICYGSISKELWREELADDVDLNELSCQYFKTLLSKYQRNLKSLSLLIVKNRDFDFGFEQFDNLQDLKLEGDFDIGPVMTKIRNPLNSLEINVTENNTIDYDQVFKIQNLLTIISPSINNEEFLKIRSSYLYTNIGNLSEENIADFVKSYQNDTINRNAVHYSWYIDHESRFDCQKLWRLLGSREADVHKFLSIRHSTKKKAAILNYTGNTLIWRNPMG